MLKMSDLILNGNKVFYQSQSGIIELKKASISDYRNNFSIEIMIANAMIGFDEDDWFELAKEFNVFENTTDKILKIIGKTLKDEFKSNREFYITKIIDKMFTIKEISDMYSLIIK